MKAIRVAACLGIGGLLLPVVLRAQGYRARVDFEAQAAAFRGVTMDSALIGSTQVGAGGGRSTSDGFAVSCPGTAGYCYFFRPGPVRRGGPVVATAEITVWGFGMQGLSLHGVSRLGGDVGGTDVWPGTQPRAQLLEGYAEYSGNWFTARAGRVESVDRLGSIGYDGISFAGRKADLGLDASVYGGFGLARAIALPINSPNLNPLDQYQPRVRQWVAGGSLGWVHRFGSARVMYQREVERRTKHFISERTALDLAIRPPVRGISVTAGADYDMALAEWGSAEAQLNVARGPVAASFGGRRYNPHFDLWTIWGSFSPTPFHAVLGNLRVAPVRWGSASGHIERYRYDDTGAETALVSVANRGWRWSVGADATPHPAVGLSANYRREHGPGAASSGFDGTVSYLHGTDASISLTGASLQRPLEFRFDDARVWMIGVQAALHPTARLSFSVGAGRYMEDRRRPDAGAVSWDQTRFDIRLSYQFGTNADALPLPPAIRTREP